MFAFKEVYLSGMRFILVSETKEETEMYIPNDDTKFFMIWKVRSNEHGKKWLTKEDCPSRIYNESSFAEAKTEAIRLCKKHNCEFVIVQGMMLVTPPKQPDVETKWLS